MPPAATDPDITSDDEDEDMNELERVLEVQNNSFIQLQEKRAFRIAMETDEMMKSFVHEPTSSYVEGFKKLFNLPQAERALRTCGAVVYVFIYLFIYLFIY
jgi:hypothetical protein